MVDMKCFVTDLLVLFIPQQFFRSICKVAAMVQFIHGRPITPNASTQDSTIRSYGTYRSVRLSIYVNLQYFAFWACNEWFWDTHKLLSEISSDMWYILISSFCSVITHFQYVSSDSSAAHLYIYSVHFQNTLTPKLCASRSCFLPRASFWMIPQRRTMPFRELAKKLKPRPHCGK